jgi:chemotaxis protein MotB
MSGGGGGGRKRKGHEEEHENHERWLVTYADMLTVLMALFIVLFALSVVDKQKFQKFAEGLNGDLGSGAGVLDGGPGLQQSGDSVAVDLQAAITALNSQQAREQAAAKEKDDLAQAREKIRQALVAKHMESSVRFEIDERGLVVTVVTDDVLFELGSAALRPTGSAVLDAIAPALKALPNQVTVEGHTDDLPIRGRFASNWELSTERATSVLRYLLDSHAVPAKRLSAAGYADQRPLAPNTSPAARSANRRVEVIVRATPAEALPASKPTAIPPMTAIPPVTAGIPALRRPADAEHETSTTPEHETPEHETPDPPATSDGEH